MAQSLFNARRNATDPVHGDLVEQFYLEEEIFTSFPWMSTGGAIAWPYKVEGRLPGIGFRKLNEALPSGIGIVQRPVETLKPFGLDSDTDKVIAKANPLERQATDRMTAKAIAAMLIQSVIYGNSPASRAGTAFDDIDGFDGLMARMAAAPGAPQVVDNGASSGSDGSSVIVIRYGDGYVSGLMQDPLPGISVKIFGELETLPVHRTRIDACAGLKIAHGRAVSWLKDITEATPIVKAKLDQAIDKVAGRPDALWMTKRTRTQLRTVLHAMGIPLGLRLDELGNPMETYGGIPIRISDAMIDTETVS